MKVLVVGAGMMGRAIAELCAIQGHEVFLVDIKEEILRDALAEIKFSLEELKSKGRISSVEEVMSRIRTTKNLEEFAGEADLVIEAIVEDAKAKKELFSKLDGLCKEGTIFTSNTSSIPISDLASATNRQDRFAGLHFFNPPLLIRFVEIIMHEKVSEKTISEIKKFASSIGMSYVIVRKDVAGFIVNRIAIRTFIEALRLAEEGYGYAEIDLLAKNRLGYPMGIFELADFVGLDIIYAVLKQMKASGVSVEIPSLIEEMVKEGRLGIKTGRGFYEYGLKVKRAKIDTSRIFEINPLRLVATAVNEAAWLIRNQVSGASEIDFSLKKGLNLPKGLLEHADDLGVDKIVETLDSLYKNKGISEYVKDPLLAEMIKNNKLGKKTGAGFYNWVYEREDLGMVIYEKRHDHAVITLNRPEKLNALNEIMWKALKEAFDRASKDKEIRAIFIKGEGRAFSSGDDIAVMGSWTSFKEGREFFENTIAPFVLGMLSYEKPVISLVNGLAFGAGFEMNLLFDIVIASEEATFSLPEGLIGAMPPIASTLGLLMLGRRMARLCLTGEQVSAREAKELGIVDYVVAKDQLEIFAIEILDKIKRLAPLSAKSIKRSLNSVKSLILNSLTIGAEELSMLVASDDFKEGMKAFLERRQPVWKGQ